MILLQSPLSPYTAETFYTCMREISSGTRKIKTKKQNRNFKNDIRGYSLIIYSIIIQ